MGSPVVSRKPWLRLPWRRSRPCQAEGSITELHGEGNSTALVAADPQAGRRRQETDQRLLSEGGITSRARERLSSSRRADQVDGVFTSDLSPAEAALLRRNGCRPPGLVSGSAVYHLGNFYPPGYFVDCEVQALSDAFNTATSLAVERMRQEAALLGAHGVVGVRFTMARHQWVQRSVEIVLIGTAIAGPDGRVGAPWLSNLSGQDWWALQRAGYDPVSLVYGHCTWFVVTTEFDEASRRRSAPSAELEHCSVALRQCRKRANGLVRTMVRQAKAQGVVGVHISRQLDAYKLGGPRAAMGMEASRQIQGSIKVPEEQFWASGRHMRAFNPAMNAEHRNLTLSIIGTAIRLRRDAPSTIAATRPVLSLRDGRFVPSVVSTTEATFE